MTTMAAVARHKNLQILALGQRDLQVHYSAPCSVPRVRPRVDGLGPDLIFVPKTIFGITMGLGGSTRLFFYMTVAR